MPSKRLPLVRSITTLALLVLIALPLAAARKTAAPASGLKNICPGQDCAFNTEWRARGDVAVYKNRDVNSEVVFHLAKGDAVTGLGSQLVIRKAGLCVANQPVAAYERTTKAPVNLKARDRISALYFSGDGYVVGTFQRKHIEACCVGAEIDCKTQPENELWLQVKSQSGVLGWTNQRDKFAGTSE